MFIEGETNILDWFTPKGPIILEAKNTPLNSDLKRMPTFAHLGKKELHVIQHTNTNPLQCMLKGVRVLECDFAEEVNHPTSLHTQITRVSHH